MFISMCVMNQPRLIMIICNNSANDRFVPGTVQHKMSARIWMKHEMRLFTPKSENDMKLKLISDWYDECQNMDET